jgi:hypothetical protein
MQRCFTIYLVVVPRVVLVDLFGTIDLAAVLDVAYLAIRKDNLVTYQ